MIPNLAPALNGWTENLNASKLLLENTSGIVNQSFIPIEINGNLQMGNNDDLQMVPEQERHFALWRLLVQETTPTLRQGDIVKITQDKIERLYKVIGVKDNTRSGFVRYFIQERYNDALNLPDGNWLMSQSGKFLIAQEGA